MGHIWFVLFAVVSIVYADVYLHFPPGSNNRVNEQSANRANANNAFDSQNNNRGGYNVPDATKDPAVQNANLQYFYKFFQSGTTGKSIVHFVWTNQHGCGGSEENNPGKLTCNLIFQYMCQDDDLDDNNLDKFRHGVETTTQDFTVGGTKQNDVKKTRRLHESWDHYNRCQTRQRNQGLFIADQPMKGNTAKYTRQDAAGQRYGYECPEERDYWPYISPWTDIAMLTTNTSMCNYYQKESYNVKPRYECIETKNAARIPSKWNNENDCLGNSGRWLLLYSYLEKAPAYTTQAQCEQASTSTYQYKWALPHDTTTVKEECLVLNPEQGPECLQAQWSRTNYLGLNSEAEPISYDWVLPSFPSNKVKRCVARLRYNISAYDYDFYTIDSTSNGNKSPIVQDPVLTVDNGIQLQMNLNTDQIGRTFQDRTHLFKILPRPAGVSATENIYNWNVLGKRGNIVQNYPSVEYDFTPRTLEITSNDLVHIQWAGANTHNNGNPGGDGQTGDDGQGKTGTDRSNLVEMRNRDENYPLPYEHTTFWKNVQVRWSPMEKSASSIKQDDLALYFASSGYYRCKHAADCPGGDAGYIYDTATTKLDPLLDVAPASFEGALLKVNRGTYHMMCTRNNNFSNRAQKATLIVT